ncbi:hypothetical protein IEQ_05014 [Bacillus cereus BAG6X1-2]|nr:hypothetical protein IEQ_05014 [Bacillus cereus BAG6X1-2]
MGEILSIISVSILASSCTSWIIDVIKVIREKRAVSRMVEKEMEQLKAIKGEGYFIEHSKRR